MNKLYKIFGEINLTWPKVIILAIIIGIYTAIMAILPIAENTSFSDLTVTMEVWILFGIFIIMNSKSAIDSALKCFVFFLISQPLIYLIQVPFSSLGWQIFIYYKFWFIWTLLTIPMGFIGYYMKKDKWWGLIILTPILVLLGNFFGDYLRLTMFSFPRHILTVIFCVVTMLIYPIAIFKDKKVKIAGVVIGLIILITFGALTFMKPSEYTTTLLVSEGSMDVKFDDTYKVYLADESMGTVDIRKELGINDWTVHAVFVKTGNTELTLESSTGEKITFDLQVETDTYNINKK